MAPQAQRRWISAAIAAVVALVMASLIAALLGLRYTWTGSVPRGLYRVVARPIDRGDIVVVCLPEPVGRWAEGRGYLPSGSCPGGAAPIGKPLEGLGEDEVTVSASGVAINGRRLPHSKRVFRDSRDRPMPTVAEGTRMLEPGQLWLHSGHHLRSLDSRIYGPVTEEAVLLVLVPLWVEGS